MVWALTRVVIFSDDEDSAIFGEGAAFSLSPERDSVTAEPFADTELDEYDRALSWLDTDDLI